MPTETSDNPKFSPEEILKQAKASVAFLDLARAQALPSSTQGSANANRLFLDLLSSVNHYLGALSFEDKGLEKQRDELLSANVARGMKFDPDFAVRQKTANGLTGNALGNEHGDTVPLAKLEARSLELENISRRIRKSAGQSFSRLDITTSKNILWDAVHAPDSSSNSVHAALTHDIEQRNKRRSVWTMAKRVWRDPGFEKQKRRKMRDYRGAREKSINLAVDAVMNSADVEGGTLKLARAIASDPDLRSAFKYHRKFQELVQTINHSGLNQLCEEIAADPKKNHPLTSPDIAYDLRRQRATAGVEQVPDSERHERAPIGVDRTPDTGRYEAGVGPVTEIQRRHEHYTGDYDLRGSPLLSRHIGSTALKQLTRLAVPEGGPVDLLHDDHFTPGQLNKIRENLHLARIGAIGNDADVKGLSSFLDNVPVKITEDTGWESRMSGKRQTRRYVEGVGEISRDKSALYIKPAEILADDGVQTILRRARATLGLPFVEQSVEFKRDDKVERSGEMEEPISGRDEKSVLAGTGSDARLLKINDSLLYTKDCGSAGMMEGDVGIIRSFDHANSQALIEDADGGLLPMNYKEFHDFVVQTPMSVEQERHDEVERTGETEEPVFGRDENSVLVGTGSDARLLKINDTLLYEKDCRSAGMMEGDIGIIRSFDHANGEALIEDSDGYQSPMNYKEFHDFVVQTPMSAEQERDDKNEKVDGKEELGSVRDGSSVRDSESSDHLDQAIVQDGKGEEQDFIGDEAASLQNTREEEYPVSSRDENSIVIGTGSGARRLRINDVLLYTKDCDSAGMMERDTGIIRSFDHANNQALIEDTDGGLSPMNYKEFHDFVIQEPVSTGHDRDDIDFGSPAVQWPELVRSESLENGEDEREIEEDSASELDEGSGARSVGKRGLHIVSSRPDNDANTKPLEDVTNGRPGRYELGHLASARGPDAALDVRPPAVGRVG